MLDVEAEDDADDANAAGTVGAVGAKDVGCSFMTWFLYVLGVFKNLEHIGQAYP